MKKILTSVTLSILAAGMLLAQDDNAITLPNGTVLRNPYLLGQTPSTITVGHDDGAIRLAIKDLPPEYREALNFDPAKAAAHAKMQAAATALTEMNIAESERQHEVQALQKKIQGLKVRIAADEANLEKLGAVFAADKEGATRLAAVQPSYGYRRYTGYWGRWGLRRFHRRRGGDRAASRAVRERVRQIRRMNAESEKIAQAYFALDAKLQEEKIQLGELEVRLAQLTRR